MITSVIRDLYIFRNTQEQTISDFIKDIYSLTLCLHDFFDDPQRYQQDLITCLSNLDNVDINLHINDSNTLESWECRFYLAVQIHLLNNNQYFLNQWESTNTIAIKLLFDWQKKIGFLDIKKTLAGLTPTILQQTVNNQVTYMYILAFIHVCHLDSHYAQVNIYIFILKKISSFSPFINVALSSYIIKTPHVNSLLSLDEYLSDTPSCLEVLENYSYWIEDLN